MLEENQLNTDFFLLSYFPIIPFTERPARPTATERLSLRTCTKTSPRRPETLVEPNLWSSVRAAHRSRTNTKETGGFLSHSSHHNGCIFLPASDCPPSFLPAHVAPHCGTSGHRLLMEKKKVFSSLCLLSCWVLRQTCGMFVFRIICNSDCCWRSENRIVRVVSQRCAAVGETVALKQLIFSKPLFA